MPEPVHPPEDFPKEPAKDRAPALTELTAVPTPSPASRTKSSLTLFQANVLVAMLAGFWGRQADGHPGPDLMGRGLLMLTALVRWEKNKKQRPPENAHRNQPHRKPG